MPDDRSETRAREAEFLRSFAPEPDSARRLLDEAIDGLSDRSAAAVAAWVEACVRRIVIGYGRLDSDAAQAAFARAREMGSEAGRESVEKLRSLKTPDFARPGSAGPLEVLRGLYLYPTRVLVEAGVPAVERDIFEIEHFPDDIYELRIQSFHDLGGGGGGGGGGGDEMATLHLVWGAAKAAVLRAERGSLFE